MKIPCDGSHLKLCITKMEYICKYCNKSCKNKNSLIQHEIRCKMNPNKIDVKSNFIQYNKDIKEGIIEKIYSNQYTKSKILGLPKPEIKEETRKKLSNAWKGKTHKEETKKKISLAMKRVVKEKPESYSSSNVNGRVKKVKYNNQIFDSSWEVIVAKFLDENGYEWYKPTNGFEYFWENNTHLYYPDFYIPSLNLYIEVKGYKRDRDEYKWKVMDNLFIIGNKEINSINKGTFKLPQQFRGANEKREHQVAQ